MKTLQLLYVDTFSVLSIILLNITQNDMTAYIGWFVGVTAGLYNVFRLVDWVITKFKTKKNEIL